ncbi:hypothetical protein PAXRUDRAFT_162029, partial [Paxillus rubicundulus Ve08.2h10]
VAHKFVSLSSELLQCLAMCLEEENKYSELSTEERDVMSLLQQVDTIAACIPGSEASKIYMCNGIRSYFSYFGLPQLCFTFNLCAAHSPIFQVMYGDCTIDLSQHFP